MLSHRRKILLLITVILVAVILIIFGLFSFFKNRNTEPINEEPLVEEFHYRHPLSGEKTKDPIDFYPVIVMIDNAYNIRPQYGLEQADVIYEAFAEGNITRLMAVFDDNKNVEKVGPVRSARPYFMDFANEYAGVYMHVGGSPEALGEINSYDFTNIDQIGASEIYFWRDENLEAPHNVFTSSANWLRVGEIKDVNNCDQSIIWNFIDSQDGYVDKPDNFSIDYNATYKVDWKFNDKIKLYQRYQGGDEFLFASGDQATAANIIVQVVPSKIIDDKERRSMETSRGGKVYIFNNFGKQEGIWGFSEGRTRFFNDKGEELKLIPGKTWLQIVPSEETLLLEQVVE